MKRLILILSMTSLLFACKKECNEPAAPYGRADDVTRYNSSGYNSVTYTYYCRNFKYVSVTYTNTEGCKWEKSEYTSTGICKR